MQQERFKMIAKEEVPEEIIKLKERAGMVDTTLENIDKLIDLNKQQLVNLKMLRLGLTVEKYFPEVRENGGKFFVIRKDNYRKRQMGDIRHSQLEIKGIQKEFKFKKDEHQRLRLVNPMEIIICDLNSPMNDRDFVIVKSFALPEEDRDVYSFAKRK